MSAEPYANIHHYDGCTSDTDVDGEPMLGYYFELMNGEGFAVCGLMGPYNDKAEAEAAASRAAERGDL